MNLANAILPILYAWLPIASGMAWGAIMWLASYDSLTEQEKLLKRLLASFFFLSSFGWFSVFVYNRIPAWFVVLNVPAYLAFLLAPVQFYLFIRALSDEPARRSYALHYLAPLLLCGVLLASSLFVPYDVNLALVKGRGAIYPGYEAYSRLFLSKPAVRLIFSTFYTVISLVYLYRYYRQITRPGETKGKYPSRWVLLLMFFTLSLMLATLAVAFIPRGKTYDTLFILLPVFFQVSQQLLLVYTVIRRNFLPYALSVPSRIGKPAPQRTARKTYTRYADEPVKRKPFEAYMRKNKPYLNPHLKITDLAEALQVNRAYLSGFVNRTYGVNFNTYINQCRIIEMERIRRLPSNARKQTSELIGEAGFGSYRSYIRARGLMKKTEEEANDE